MGTENNWPKKHVFTDLEVMQKWCFASNLCLSNDSIIIIKFDTTLDISTEFDSICFWILFQIIIIYEKIVKKFNSCETKTRILIKLFEKFEWNHSLH